MIRSIAVIFGVATLVACGGGSSGSSDASAAGVTRSVPVEINFSAVMGSAALACDVDYTDVGTAATTTQIKDFRLYVHDIQLVTDADEVVALTLDTSDWQAQGVALLDFENATGECTGTAETNSAVSGTVPDSGAVFNAVRFTVGIPQHLNHLEQVSVSPFNITGMNWGWTNGYKFIRFDVPNWNLHIGATGCAAGGGGDIECTHSNRPQIALSNFNYQTQRIQIDFGALLQGSDITTNLGGPSGCMSGGTDPECNEVFTQLGLSLVSGENDPGLTQTVFSVAD
ncbi:MbnP family copper-binding protein [Ketobacter alkanivorans]|nr:MbnP family copper-binding protein [Ketobacter alkanivorans]